MEEKQFHHGNKNFYHFNLKSVIFWLISFALICLLTEIFFALFFSIYYQNNIRAILLISLNMLGYFFHTFMLFLLTEDSLNISKYFFGFIAIVKTFALLMFSISYKPTCFFKLLFCTANISQSMYLQIKSV